MKRDPSTPTWLPKVAATVPGIAEAWADPLFEHVRDREQLRTWKQYVSPEGWAVAFCAAVVGGVSVFFPTSQFIAFAMILLMATLHAFQLLARTYLDHRSDPLAFLRDPRHPLWKELPIEPERAARLVALKAMIDGTRPLTGLYTGAIQFSGFFAFGMLLLVAEMIIGGPTASAIAVTIAVAVAIFSGLGRAFEKNYMNPVGDCVHIGVSSLCTFAERMDFPPLSKDPTATSNEKKARYSEFVFEVVMTGATNSRRGAVWEDQPTREERAVEVYKNALEGFAGCWKRWAKRGADTN